MSGKKIGMQAKPLDPQKAAEWVESRTTSGGESPTPKAKPVEKGKGSEKRVRFSLDLDEGLHTALKALAVQKRTTVADMLRELVTNLVDKEMSKDLKAHFIK